MSFDIGPNIVVVILAVIAAVPGIIAAIYAHDARQNAKEAAANTTATATKIDGRMDELLNLAKTSSRAEGVVAGAAGEQPGDVNGILPKGKAS